MTTRDKTARKRQKADANPNGTVPEPNCAAAGQADRLREAIDQAGGPIAVARKSGIPFGSIQHYRQGREMRATALAPLAEACNVSIEWLATGKGPMRAGDHPRPPPAPPMHLKLFGSVDMGTMAQAMEVATLTFRARGITPSYRRMAQVTMLIYDTLHEPDGDPGQVERVLSAADPVDKSSC